VDVKVADGKYIKSTQKGALGILKDVYYAPDLDSNLVFHAALVLQQ
jgi:hypothetical protein